MQTSCIKKGTDNTNFKQFILNNVLIFIFVMLMVWTGLKINYFWSVKTFNKNMALNNECISFIKHNNWSIHSITFSTRVIHHRLFRLFDSYNENWYGVDVKETKIKPEWNVNGLQWMTRKPSYHMTDCSRPQNIIIQ